MPIYDYRCRACGHTFDRLRPLADADDVTSCPSCEAGDSARLPSRIAQRVTSGAALPMAGGSSAPAPAGGCCGGGCCS